MIASKTLMPTGGTVTVDVTADLLLSFGKKLNGESMTQLDMQKMMYFVQGWHLALRDEPLFEEDFWAWKHGPVLKSLWGRFKVFRERPITASSITSNPEVELSLGVRDLVYKVWCHYSKEEPWSLVGFTHLRATPWAIVRKEKGIEIGQDSDILIPQKLLHVHFSSLLQGKLIPKSDVDMTNAEMEWNLLEA